MAQYSQTEIASKLTGVQPLHQNTGVCQTVAPIQSDLNVTCQAAPDTSPPVAPVIQPTNPLAL